jgi:hypothetical protein
VLAQQVRPPGPDQCGDDAGVLGDLAVQQPHAAGQGFEARAAADLVVWDDLGNPSRPFTLEMTAPADW